MDTKSVTRLIRLIVRLDAVRLLPISVQAALVAFDRSLDLPDGDLDVLGSAFDLDESISLLDIGYLNITA